MEQSAFRRQLESAVNARHSRLNPFTEKWVAGELTRPQLGAWAAQHYQYVSQFPRWCAWPRPRGRPRARASRRGGSR